MSLLAALLLLLSFTTVRGQHLDDISIGGLVTDQQGAVVAGGTVAREEVERLPLASRSVLDFVFTLGGVAEEPLSVRDAAAVARRPTVSAFRPKIRLS